MSTQYPSRGEYFPGIVVSVERYIDMGPLNDTLPLEQRLLRVEHEADFCGVTRVFETHGAAVAWCYAMKADAIR